MRRSFLVNFNDLQTLPLFLYPKSEREEDEDVEIFMYGSELQELEQLMMLVPNFLSRRSGVIVVQRIRNEEVPSGFERDYEHITAYCSSNGSSSFTNQIAGGTLIMKRLSTVA